MAPRATQPPQRRTAVLNDAQITAAVPKIERRIADLQTLEVSSLTDETGDAVLKALGAKVNATLRDIFDVDTIEYNEFNVGNLYPNYPLFMNSSRNGIQYHLQETQSHIDGKVHHLQSLVAILKEKLEDVGDDSTQRAVKAYDGLMLHPEIARRPSSLYRDGHYANAVEAAVKALNGLVRLRSDLEFDGSTLMERAFNPKNPAIKFNSLSDQSDQDEQKGYMMLFSGAVAGLRNPRAHGFINDQPERALEFIAFISLLAKLLDEAQG